MAYKRTSTKFGGKGGRTTKTINTRTGKQTVSTSQKLGNNLRVTQNSNGDVWHTRTDAGGWVTKQKMNKKPKPAPKPRRKKAADGWSIWVWAIVAVAAYFFFVH
jgi:hypothetical protein